MRRHWIRRPSRWNETLAAALLAGGAAAATFYVTRIVLSREALPEPRRPEEVGEGPEDGEASRG